MDRNSVIGLLLIGVVVVVFSVMNQPSKEQLEAIKRQRDSVETVNKIKEHAAQENARAQLKVDSTSMELQDSTANQDSVQISLREQKFGAFASASEGKPSFFTIENDLLKISVSAKGGRPARIELKKYKTYEGKPLIICDEDSSSFGFNFFSQNRTISTNELFFDKTISTDSSLSVQLNAGKGRYILYNYILTNGSYLVAFSVTFRNMHDLVAPNTNYIELDWKQKLLKTEKDMANERMNASVYYRFTDDEVENISEAEDGSENLTTKIKWVAFKQHFFTSALISGNGFEKPTKVETVTDANSQNYVKECKAVFNIPYSHKPDETLAMNFYFGPNHFQTLKKLDLGMEKLISLGFFGFVNKWLVIPVFNWLNSFNLNFGIIILILTILIRIILLPLTYKSFMATAKMRVLQPEVTEINQKYPDDPMKKQQELMGLYRRAGVNPLGGCIPALLQIPILFAMFSFFPTSIELRQESFLWAKDLSTYDSIANLPFHIPFYGAHVSLFTILMTVSTLLYTAINMQMTSAVNPQMKWMMYLMPIMFLGVFNSYSAGLSYYYFLSNLCGLGQQFLFKAFVDEDVIHKKIQENKKKPVSKSKFQQRLEAMAKERGVKAPRK